MRNILSGLLIMAGSALSGLGFMAFNWVSVLVDKATGYELLQQRNTLSQIFAQSVPLDLQLGSLILIPAVSAIGLILGFLIFTHPGRSNLVHKLAALLLALFTAYPLVLVYAVIGSGQGMEYFSGLGYWMSVVGNVMVFISALLGYTAARLEKKSIREFDRRDLGVAREIERRYEPQFDIAAQIAERKGRLEEELKE